MLACIHPYKYTETQVYAELFKCAQFTPSTDRLLSLFKAQKKINSESSVNFAC